MARVLQIGRSGQVATEFARSADAAGFRRSVLGRPQIDLTAPASVEDAIRTVDEFDVLVNCAAYTAVDQAESEPDAAYAVNAESVEAMGRAAAARGAAVVHLSTDYVFDGSKAGAYREDDPVAPLGVYGRTKLDGEIRLAAAAPRSVVMRTAWVYSARGKNFVKTMLRVGRDRVELTVVDDQRGCPTSAADIASALVEIVRQVADAPAGDTRFGVFHYCGAGETTWRRFAEAVFESARGWPYPVPRVQAIRTEDYPTPARRPANSVLDTGRIASVYGIQARPWRDALADVMNELRTQQE